MVPTLTCGLFRSNFCLAIGGSLLSFYSELAASVDDVARDRLRYFLVPIEVHVEVGPALRHRAQVGRVPEHFRQRDQCLDDLRVADGVHRLDAAAAAVQVAHDVAEVVLGRRDLDGHHRLEQVPPRALEGFLERHRACDLERTLARVDLVVRPVDELDRDVDDRVAGEHARVHRFRDARVHRGDVLARDLAADDLVAELVALARLLRAEVDHDVRVLARAAGLAHELLANVLYVPARGLAVGDLRTADVRLDVELALETVDDDLQVQLAHPR